MTFGNTRFKGLLVGAMAPLALICLVATAAHGQGSPGPLTASHAKIDGPTNCQLCHNGPTALDENKCLNCHAHNDLRSRIRAGKGFHASSKVRGTGKKCWHCHLDHKGRGFDPMGWSGIGGKNAFDHAWTGWRLKGKHRSLDCTKCHKKRNPVGIRTYLGEKKICGSCHKQDQPHKFKSGTRNMRCERCHTESVWKPPKRRLDFDHNKKSDAAMPLEGSHVAVSCKKCHPRARFNLGRSRPDNCIHCHKTNHKGHMFDKKPCTWCHSPKFRSLARFTFNHKARTRFDLAGSHGKLNCYKCHTKKLGFRKPNRACEQCHAKDNKHGTRFNAFGNPPRCSTCHPSSSWKPSRFNHNRRTRFKLTGKHRTTTNCRKCHRGRSPRDFEKFTSLVSRRGKTACMSCHRHKTAHFKNGKPQYNNNQCLNCHKSAGKITITKKAVRLYHGPKSRFPLIYNHKRVKCIQCHVNDSYTNTPRECGARCHDDSLHKGSLGDKCSDCHQPGRWKAVFFDHTDDTKWPLKGLHKTVPKCEDCHPARLYSKTPTNCGAKGCHAKDDAHKGRLGNKCEKCHLETGANIFNHNTMSKYPLTGKHLTTKCSSCHPDVRFKPLPTNCFGCHAEPDIHKGRYGTACETCHTTKSFRNIKPLHDVGNFSLKGSHDNLACKTCHKNNRPLAGSGNLCINCHRQDDIHSNSLSPRCGECHSQWSFAPARFDHTTVGCNLTGLHRVLPCYDCHKTGNFGGLSPNCYGCHRDTALKVVAPDHSGFVACGTCHNPNAWKPAGAGVAGYGKESICR